MKQELESSVVICSRQLWRQRAGGLEVTGRGPASLLEQPLTAFFASRECTGWAIRAGLEWALLQARSSNPIVSGFQSPLERSVLELLLEARSPTVLVLARPVESARLPARWSVALDRQHLVMISAQGESRRLDREQASARNEVVAMLANNIVIAHAAPGGGLEAQANAWGDSGKSVHFLDV